MYSKPSESELEILQILWEKGPSSVRDVHEELAKTKEVGYTTTLKLMQRIYDKKLVDRDDSIKTHIYRALISIEQAEDTAIDKVIQTVFKGSTASLVIKALGRNKTSAAEIDKIRDYLKKFDK
jgi:BlaI family penicillinase repressor